MFYLIIPLFIGLLVTDMTLAQHVTIPSNVVTPSVPVENFSYFFDHEGVVEEAESPDKSTSPYWWLNSGGQLVIKNGKGSTLSKIFEVTPEWHSRYLASNPVDTDNGLHPQNLFRLLTKKKWSNEEESVSVKITKINVSDSANRNESNGIFLLSRYQDHNNLYYAGIRVDGYAVIKKKKNGLYTTLATLPVFEKDKKYDRSLLPNLLPLGQWIGLKSSTQNVAGGVLISLWVDKNNMGNWEKVLEAQDTTEPFVQTAFSGIRTDFMDVEFDNFFQKPIEVKK